MRCSTYSAVLAVFRWGWSVPACAPSPSARSSRSPAACCANIGLRCLSMTTFESSRGIELPLMSSVEAIPASPSARPRAAGGLPRISGRKCCVSSIDAAQPTSSSKMSKKRRAISNAASDLRVLGYRTYQRRISAADCGADHQRNRWWLVAYPDSKSELHRALDAEVAKLPEICRDLWGAANYAGAVRVSSRLSRRMDRSRIEALGNAVLPQITEAIGMAILAAEMANA